MESKNLKSDVQRTKSEVQRNREKKKKKKKRYEGLWRLMWKKEMNVREEDGRVNERREVRMREE
jgi:hypothetical protein